MKNRSRRLLSAPLIVNWSLSYRCNFDCRHCYSRTEKSKELTTEEVLEAGRRLTGAGVLFVNFGGGEPLLHPGLYGIARRLTDMGLSCSMNSNGWLLDENAAGQLKEAGFTSVGLSLDSHLPEVHDRFRNRPGSFHRVLEAAGHLVDKGVKMTVSTVISRLNAGELASLIDLVRGMGAAQLYLHNFKCSGRGFENREELDLYPWEWKEFYRTGPRRRRGGKGSGDLLRRSDPGVPRGPGRGLECFRIGMRQALPAPETRRRPDPLRFHTPRSRQHSP